ncbi:FAD/NAD(P)-binding domain-containing protein [Rhizodiscina lignyota]|uniref:FAD/NAD(P)-binding domain-containing protein n=1 Tax=Rhizodiscina lignyota TaxID=1504668 RepID=A0A9P4M3Q6_9PEZI|nr:FAD/NAD(P)-binding domain-containing protein [Rhizodiscina lignyota]
MSSSKRRELHVCIVGAGIGGLAAAIAIAQAGAKVTVLEAAEELGEIGAGIQMTPNASRLLIRWGVDKEIGEDLVCFDELNMRRKDGRKIGYTLIKRVETACGTPWWVVHRHHLHNGLAKVAQRYGADIKIDSRVATIKWSDKVTVSTEKGTTYTFDFLIGADGVSSIVRRTLYPNVTPTPPTNNAAYRAIVPFSQIAEDPIARELIGGPSGSKRSMEVWMAPKSYIISYPISNGRDFNMVLSHHRPAPVPKLEDIDMQELYDEYKDYDPRIKRIVDMIPSAQRWPLLVTGPLDSWSNDRKNIVVMGDAAHSMTNHMAQGAATSMEDGAFLGTCMKAYIEGTLPDMKTVVDLYEQNRMPLADMKQQVSFLNGAIWMLDGEDADARDATMAPELTGAAERGELLRSANLYGDPQCVAQVYGYNVIEHADWAVDDWTRRMRAVGQRALGERGGWGKKDDGKDVLGIDGRENWKWMGWFAKGPRL